MGNGHLEEVIKSIDEIFATSPDLVYVYNRDGEYLYANESGVKIYGLTKSSIIGKKWSKPNLAPEVIQVFEAKLSEVFSTGRPVTLELHAQTVLGVNDFEYTLTPVMEDGVVSAAVGVARDITEQKETERALRESERRFRDLFEKSELVAVIVDNQGKTVSINDYTLNLLGRRREEVLGEEFLNFVPPEQRSELIQAFMQAILTGEILAHYKSDIVSAWGERRTIAFTNVLLHDANGNVVGTANMGQDITEELRAAEEISESRKQVLDILESITDGFFALDNIWRFTYVNQRAAEYVGRRREDLLFRNMWEVIPELAGTEFEREYHRAKEEMIPTSFEEIYPLQNKWFKVHVYPYKNGLSVYFEDITERKQSEFKLHETTEILLAIITASPLAIDAVDRDGNVKVWNPAAESLFGYKGEEIIGKPLPIFPESKKQEQLFLLESLRKEGVSTITTQLERRDGAMVDVCLSAAAVYDSAGNLAGYVAVIVDTSGRKRLEELL
ncbi:MAG: PAS domain-containing protein [Candidatus Aquicultor sp.]